jgi:hypothetical protein
MRLPSNVWPSNVWRDLMSRRCPVLRGDAGMRSARRDVLASVAALTTQLRVLPNPWDIAVLCDWLAEQRGRPLLLWPIDFPAFPFGLWYDDGQRDHVFYRAELAGFHRDHVILHELCHMIADHNRHSHRLRLGEKESDISTLISRAAGNPHSTIQEEIAELFATQILFSVRNQHAMLDDVELRAATVFGLRC